MYILSESIKKELLKEVEKTEIDVTQLNSYHYDRNPYGVEEQLIGSSSCSEWDEDEEWDEKVKELAKNIKDYGILEYVDLSDDEKIIADEITMSAYLWLLSLVENSI